MPELPEVETIVRDLKPLHGKSFSQIIVHDPFVLRLKSAGTIQRLKNQTIDKIFRRGKAVIMELSSKEFLVFQLMMTGQIVMEGMADKHTRLSFTLSDGSVFFYNDQRRFGQIRLVKDLSHINYFNILGPEPFSDEFTPALMGQALRTSSRPIKNALLDHTLVAGIGNIYACEILFCSRLSPKRQARRVKLAEIKTMHRCIRQVLNEAIVHRGSSMRNYRDGRGQKGKYNERLAVYARAGLPCPCCQKPIQRITQAGRSTFYCGHCQK